MKRVLIAVMFFLTSLLFTGCTSVTHYSPNGDSITAYPDGTTKINEGEHRRTPN